MNTFIQDFFFDSFHLKQGLKATKNQGDTECAKYEKKRNIKVTEQ